MAKREIEKMKDRGPPPFDGGNKRGGPGKDKEPKWDIPAGEDNDGATDEGGAPDSDRDWEVVGRAKEGSMSDLSYCSDEELQHEYEKRGMHKSADKGDSHEDDSSSEHKEGY